MKMGPAGALIVIPFLLTGALAQAASWRGINSGLPGAPIGVNKLVVHPATGDIYASTARGIFKSADAGESWTALTTLYGDFTLDPNDPLILYINTSCLMKSADGGATWVCIGPPGSGAGSLAIDPGDSSILCFTGSDAAHNFHIFKSTDAGASWITIDPGLPQGFWFGSPIFVPGNPAKIYVPYGGLVNNSSIAGIATTTNLGQTWATVPIPTRFTGVSGVQSLAIDLSRESTMYAAVSVSGASPGSAILKTTDAGKSWSTLNLGLPPAFFYGPLVVDPAAATTIYTAYAGFGCGGCGGIIKTTDAGAHWTIIQSSHTEGEGYTFALDPMGRGTIYAGLVHSLDPRGGILKSADGGANWTALTGPAITDVHAITVNPVNPAVIYASVGDRVFQSVDYGENWAQLVAFQSQVVGGVGDNAAIANSLAVDFMNPNVLYARTAHYNGCYYLENFLFKSTDGGANWTDTISPPASGCVLTTFWDPPWMVMDPVDPATLYVGESFEGGSAVIRTSDGGANWQNIWQLWTDDFPEAVHALAIDPSRTSTLYAGLSGTGGIFKSTDAGQTWSSSGLDGLAISALTLDPTDPRVLYAASEGLYPRPRGFGGLFKSTDGGANWLDMNQGLDGLQSRFIINSVVIDPTNSNTVYLGTSGAGVFRTLDGGAHWFPFNDGLGSLDVHVLVSVAGASATLYAGTAAGLFVVPSTPQ